MYTSYSPSFARNIATTAEGITFVMDSGKLSLNVIILADAFEDPIFFAPGSKAETNIEFDSTKIYDQVVTGENHKIKSLHRNGVTLMVQTKYMTGVASTIRSGYGRGTTVQDKKAGDITLEFHESQHATEAFDFIHKNQMPDLIIKIGMTETKVQETLDAYTKKLEAYVAKLEAFHIAQVDCVGTTAKFCK